MKHWYAGCSYQDSYSFVNGGSRNRWEAVPAKPGELSNGLDDSHEVGMKAAIVCPFYGKSDDYCDVGCGYISPYDVNMIIRYCSCRHKECLKYQELADRFPSEALDLIKC